jgi:hypothetical protein
MSNSGFLFADELGGTLRPNNVPVVAALPASAGELAGCEVLGDPPAVLAGEERRWLRLRTPPAIDLHAGRFLEGEDRPEPGGVRVGPVAGPVERPAEPDQALGDLLRGHLVGGHDTEGSQPFPREWNS